MMIAKVSVKVLLKVVAILSKKSIGGTIGNTFLMKYIGIDIGNTFLKYCKQL